MGYGDRMCSECGYIDWAENIEDFYKRIYGKKEDTTIGKTDDSS